MTDSIRHLVPIETLLQAFILIREMDDGALHGCQRNPVLPALERIANCINKIEKGERRLMLLEFIRICEQIGVEPTRQLDRILKW